MKNLLITGASGFLGWNLCMRSRSDWRVFGTYLANRVEIPDIKLFQVDLTDYNELKRLFKEIKPEAVIHTAAITSPNFCQNNPSKSYDINTGAAINIAGLCSEIEIPLLFTSTDLVFNGLKPPYSENDEPSPVSLYGEHKVLAELGMKDKYPKTVICRMPLMYGDPGPVAVSFLQPLMSDMNSGKDVNLFTDEFRTPLSGKDAAEGLMIALRRLPDIVHLGGVERISRYAFGKMLENIFGIQGAKLHACTQDDINLAAPRPPDVSFDISKALKMGFNPNSISHELEFLKNSVRFPE
jgi:dTDP-4-dehydrorhamnose reductase